MYVLIDEHQDSSGLQNEFLQKVWGEEEKPNIFVVGDDRQLIYGFGGASFSYFEGFKNNFGKAKLITLIDNYRSTQTILDSAHTLLESKITKDKLVSHHKESHPLKLVECDYPRDEIISCALDIKNKVKDGLDLNDCAILVPKNKQIRSTVAILRDMGLPVASYDTLQFFDSEDALSLIRVLKIIANPYDAVALAESFFDKNSGIEPLDAHKFIKESDIKNFSIASLLENKKATLFPENKKTEIWIEKIKNWIQQAQKLDVHTLVQLVGEELLLDKAKNHDELLSRIEIIRTLVHLVLSQLEKKPKLKLAEFLEFLERIESYGENLPLALFNSDEGVKVLTLHASKGLEFDYVWIAHMDEGSLMSGKRNGFTLPDSVAEKIEKKDEEVAKRQLYVAITRAKRFCNISYAKHSYTGRDQDLANIIKELPEDLFEKQNSGETEAIILKHNPKAYLGERQEGEKEFKISDLTKLVVKEYEKVNVSVSLLNNFFECPWKWYFRNLLKLPEPKSESLEFGNLIHAAIDKILKSSKTPTAKQIEEIVENNKDAFEIVSKWVEERLPQIAKNHQNEQSVSVKDDRFAHLNIYGKIDLIENIDFENVRVTDFKTGSVKKKSDIEKKDEEGRMSNYLRQLAMYSYLLQENPKWRKKVSESRLEFLESKNKKEAIYPRFFTPEEIVALVQDIKDYDELVKNGEWVNRPCNYNAYGKNTECEYCKRANIYK